MSPGVSPHQSWRLRENGNHGSPGRELKEPHRAGQGHLPEPHGLITDTLAVPGPSLQRLPETGFFWIETALQRVSPCPFRYLLQNLWAEWFKYETWVDSAFIWLPVVRPRPPATSFQIAGY
jgi:hypothetical protein